MSELQYFEGSSKTGEDLEIQCQECLSMSPMTFCETVHLGDDLVEDCYWCEACGAEQQVPRREGEGDRS